MSAERRPLYLGGVIGGFLASVPVLGPALGALCLSCVGFGGAAVAGAGFGFATPPFVVAGVAVFAFSWWRSLRRARRVCGPEECRRITVILPLLLGATGIATYLLIRLALVPAVDVALRQLSQAFDHQAALP